MMLQKIVFASTLVALMACGADIPKVPMREHLISEWQKLAAGEIQSADLVQAQAGTAAALGFERGFVRLPVNFKGTQIERVSWDLPVNFDLIRSKGIAFDFYCADMSVFVSCSLYLRVDGHWQQTTFMPGSNGQWSRIVLEKVEFKADNPAVNSRSFKHVDRIRISGWRGADKDTICALANVSLIPFKPDVLLLTGLSSAKDSQDLSQYQMYSDSLYDSLQRLGVESFQLDDTALDQAALEGIAVVALPYSQSLPESALRILQNFVQHGGKVMAFYTLPTGVSELLGVKKGSWIKDESGAFAGFSRVGAGVVGQPEFAPQGSWCANVYQPDATVPGGRVIAVWRSGAGKATEHPAIIATAAGAVVGHVWLRGGEPQSGALLMSLLGELAPSLWEKHARRAFDKIGQIDELDGYQAFYDFIKRGKMKTTTAALLEESATAHRQAKEAYARKDWPLSCELSERAAGLAVKCWCSSFEAVADEHRALWCHSAFGLSGQSWDDSIKFLKEHGFNAILPNMSWGATAYYPSKVLHEHSSLAEQGDQIAQCLAACRKYGVKCHIWRVCWNTGRRLSKEDAQQLREQQRLQMSDSGDDENIWLCPSHPVNQKLEVDAMLEVVRNYAVDGVHFDYIRYPSSNYCFCEGCRTRFGQRCGQELKDWPQSVKKGGAHYEQWLEFRRDNITKVVSEVATKARQIRPEVEISAAVFRHAPGDRDSVGQDWQRWCEKGWLDFVCPMDYVDSTAAFSNMVKVQKELVGDVRMYPGIGLSCWKDSSNHAVTLVRQIEAARKAGLQGFTVFNYDRYAEQSLPYLKLGVTKD
ncbi:MAG: family 10 glycosylhydrolase [Kiritimatiellae bacterium]|nr:family 10 glycosylhydrolase [Kiritimatiellia bacterium]